MSTTLANFECACCYGDDFTLNDVRICLACLYRFLILLKVVACPDGHVACIECIERGLEHALGELSKINCFAVGCNLQFTHKAITRATDNSNLKQKYVFRKIYVIFI